MSPAALPRTDPRPARPAAPAARPAASLRHLPVNLFGAVMSLAGLALAWRLATPAFGAPRAIGEAAAGLAVAAFVLVATAYLAKLARHPQAVAAEFAHPVASNFFGTVPISLLLLAPVVEPYGAAAAQAFWTLGVLATFGLGYVVVARLLRGGGDPRHAVPAWLIPGVAALDIVVTGAHMPMAWAAEVNLAALGVGTVMALVLFTLIAARLIQHESLATPMVPSQMILVAPFAIGFLAYTHLTGGVDRFAAGLFYFALFVFLLVAPRVFRRGVPFALGWWAIGFPIAALANAALGYAAARPAWPLQALAAALLLFLSAALAVLAARTLAGLLNGRLLAG